MNRCIPLRLVVAVFLVSACDSPTGPHAEPILIDATQQEMASALVMMDDVRLRLVPSISQLSGVAELNAAVQALSSSVERSHAADLDRSARRALSALAKMRAASSDAQSADLSAIDLAIDEAKRLLVYPASASARSSDAGTR